MSNKLRSVINDALAKHGHTKEANDWLLKSLHPADPSAACSGIPDRSVASTLMMNYQSTYTLSCAVANEASWSFETSWFPHPVAFGYSAVTDGQTNLVGNFLNTQVAGATHALKYTAFKELIQKWKLAYYSVTCYQDGPDLANQGSIVACQVPLQYRKLYGGGATSVAQTQMVPTQVATAEDYPAFASAQAMPQSYFNRSREGAYAVMKLDKPRWFGASDDVYCTSAYSTAGDGATVLLPTTTGSSEYPFPSLVRRYVLYAGGVITGMGGDTTSSMCNGNVIHISAQNLAPTTRFTFFVRCGFECQAVPTSSLSPQLTISPAYDPEQLRLYSLVVRELKDAYPADFNDLGKIWGVISSILRGVAPSLNLIPGIGPALATMAPQVANFGDAIRFRNQAPAPTSMRQDRPPLTIVRPERPPLQIVRAAPRYDRPVFRVTPQDLVRARQRMRRPRRSVQFARRRY